MVAVVYIVILAILCKAAFFYLSARQKSGGPAAGSKNKQLLRDAGRLAVVQQGKMKPGRSRILVTGGAGYLGREIIRQLYLSLGGDASPWSIAVFDARVLPEELARHPDVTYLRGDLRLASHVEEALQGTYLVLHVAGLMQHADTDPAALAVINVNCTRNLVEACLEAEVPCLVYTSSAVVIIPKHGTVSDRTLRPYREDDPLPAQHVSPYAASKAAAERFVVGANGHVLTTAVLRPGGIYGANDGQVVDVVRAGWPFVGDGQSHISMVWVQDCAAAHVATARIMLGLEPQPGTATIADVPAMSESDCGSRGGPSDSSNKITESTSSAITAATPTVPLGRLTGPASARRAAIAGKVFNITADGVEDPVHYGAMFGGEVCPAHSSRLRRKVNAWGQRCTCGVPLWVLEQVTYVNELLGRTVGWTPFGKFATSAALYTATAHFPCDISRAKELLGWRPTPWRTAVTAIVEGLAAEKARLRQGAVVDLLASRWKTE